MGKLSEPLRCYRQSGRNESESVCKQKKINSLVVGQSCKVELSAIPDKSFEGAITSISDKMNDSSKGYLVNIAVRNPDHLIKDGMHVEVNL